MDEAMSHFCWRRRTLWLGVLFVLLIAAIPRLYAVKQMPAFVDEVYWILDGYEALQRWRSADNAEDRWGPRILRHPGIPAAVAGGLAESTRDISADRVNENERILVLARLGIVWTGVLCCVALTLLGSRIYGLPTGLAAGSLLALSPHHVANSAWLQCDSALALFTMVSVLALVLQVREGGSRWLLLSAVAAGLAVASKLPGLLLFAYVIGVYVIAYRAGGGACRRMSARSAVSEVAVWCLVATVTLYATWPRMWSNLLEPVDTLRWAASLGGGHINYFMGSIVDAPPWYYYLVVVPLSLSEIEFLGLLAGTVWLLVKIWRGEHLRRETLLVLGWALLFLVAMSLGGKKLGPRYLLPLWPVMALMLARLAMMLAPKIARLRRPVPIFLAAACAVAALGSLVATRGDFFAHANQLLGGLAAMDRTTVVVGVAEGEVARLIDSLPHTGGMRVAGHLLSLQWHARRRLEPTQCDGLDPQVAALPTTEYLIVMRYFEQRCPAYSPEALHDQGWREVQSVVRGRVSLARIYKNRG